MTPHLKQWKKAINTEYDNLVKNNIIKWVDKLPGNKSAVSGKVIYKKKLDEDGNFKKCRTRVVARGFSQIPSEDFTKIFALVAKFATLQIFLALVAYLDWDLEKIDVVATFSEWKIGEGNLYVSTREVQEVQ